MLIRIGDFDLLKSKTCKRCGGMLFVRPIPDDTGRVLPIDEGDFQIACINGHCYNFYRTQFPALVERLEQETIEKHKRDKEEFLYGLSKNVEAEIRDTTLLSLRGKTSDDISSTMDSTTET